MRLDIAWGRPAFSFKKAPRGVSVSGGGAPALPLDKAVREAFLSCFDMKQREGGATDDDCEALALQRHAALQNEIRKGLDADALAGRLAGRCDSGSGSKASAGQCIETDPSKRPKLR